MSINMRDPWHTRYILILSKIGHRSSYIFMYRLNIEIYLYIIIVNYWNVLNCPSVAVWTFSTSKDPQRYLTQTSYIFLTPTNLHLISSASLCDLLQWAATKNQLREFGSHRWWSPQFLCEGEKIKDLVPYWHYAALSFSSGLLCFWGASLFAWAHVKPLLVSYEHK